MKQNTIKKVQGPTNGGQRSTFIFNKIDILNGVVHWISIVVFKVGKSKRKREREGEREKEGSLDI